MGMATGVTIGAADLRLGNFVVIAVFTVIAASTVAVPGHRLPHRSTEEDAAGKAQASRPGSSLPRETTTAEGSRAEGEPVPCSVPGCRSHPGRMTRPRSWRADGRAYGPGKPAAFERVECPSEVICRHRNPFVPS